MNLIRLEASLPLPPGSISTAGETTSTSESGFVSSWLCRKLFWVKNIGRYQQIHVDLQLWGIPQFETKPTGSDTGLLRNWSLVDGSKHVKTSVEAQMFSSMFGTNTIQLFGVMW